MDYQEVRMNHHNNHNGGPEGEQVELGLGDSSDDDFETVVNRKRHSNNVNSLKLRNGGMDSGKRQEQFHQTNQNRNNSVQRRSFRDRGRRKVGLGGQENRDIQFNSRHQKGGGGERDKRQQINTVPSQQQPPTGKIHHQNNLVSSNSSVVSSVVNGVNNGIGRSNGVTNGSICSESGSSSLGTAESSSCVNNHHDGTSSLLDVVDSPHLVHQPDQCNVLQLTHFRHLSGGSVSGSASTCEIDHPDIAQIHQNHNPGDESSIIKPQFVVVPPPAVNPWRVNPNAASIIAKKVPGQQTSSSAIATQQTPQEKSTPNSQPSQKKSVIVNVNGGGSNYNNYNNKSNNQTDFRIQRDRNPGGRNYRGQKIQKENRDTRKHGERDRDKRQQINAVPSQQQPPTNNSKPISSISQTNCNQISNTINKSSSCANGSSTSVSTSSSSSPPHNKDNKKISNNGSVCVSESGGGASPGGTPESLNINNKDVVVDDHETLPTHSCRHLSGSGESGSASALSTCGELTDPVVQSDDTAQIQNSDESSIIKPQFIVAPPPAVNPWRVNPNAASIIAKKPPMTTISSTPTKPVVVSSPQTSHQNYNKDIKKKAPVTALNGEQKQQQHNQGTEKDKTCTSPNATNNTKAVTINNTTQLTNTSTTANSQTVEQSPASKIIHKTTLFPPTTTKNLTELSQPPLHKEIQEQVPLSLPRRAFAAVARSQKIGLHRDQQRPGARNSQEDWPSLQETLVTASVASASSKSVITMTTQEPGKIMTGNTIDSTTEDSSEDFDILKQRKELPANKWPSISDGNNGTATSQDENINKNALNTASSSEATVDEDETPSETSNSGDTIATKRRQRPIIADGQEEEVFLNNNNNTKNNGSMSSSDDNEHGNMSNELDVDSEAISGAGRKGKKSKQKWVPLSLPETPSSKARTKRERERNSAEREMNNMKESFNHKESATITKPKPKISSNKEDGPVSSEGRSDGRSTTHTYPSRGRGRNNNNGGRGGRGGRLRNHQHWNNYRDVHDQQQGGGNNNATSPEGREEYTDYPPDYTTLPPMYPVTEFIMPYLTNGYFPAATFTSPPPGAVLDDAQITSAYVPVDDIVVNDMVKKQIEYYFSEENLEKDFYLRRKMDADGFLPVNFIATFPRVKNMTQDYNVVIQAIQSSDELELREDLNYVRTRKEASKWPIANDAALVANPPIHAVKPFPPTSVMAYQTPNGFVSLSVSSLQAPVPTIVGISIAEKLNPLLNPNVPEFVPKSKVTESV